MSSKAERIGKLCNYVIEVIKEQQHEIEVLRNWNACEADRYRSLLESEKRCIDLEEQVGRLQAQAAAMREVILELKPSCGFCNPENCSSDCRNHKLFEMIDAALSSDSSKDYHNPTDVEALKKVREALKRCMVTAFSDERNMAGEAMATKDKALGGIENEKD